MKPGLLFSNFVGSLYIREELFFTVKPVLNGPSKRRPKLFFKTNYHLMQVKSIAESSKRALCNTLTFIKLPFVFKTFVLSILEGPLKKGFTVYIFCIFYVLVLSEYLGLADALRLKVYSSIFLSAHVQQCVQE